MFGKKIKWWKLFWCILSFSLLWQSVDTLDNTSSGVKAFIAFFWIAIALSIFWTDFPFWEDKK